MSFSLSWMVKWLTLKMLNRSIWWCLWLFCRNRWSCWNILLWRWRAAFEHDNDAIQRFFQLLKLCSSLVKPLVILHLLLLDFLKLRSKKGLDSWWREWTCSRFCCNRGLFYFNTSILLPLSSISPFKYENVWLQDSW